MMQNWNVDRTQVQAQQDGLKKKFEFKYLGHGPKATGFLSKTFKRKEGLYARCTQCGYYMPLAAKGSEDCMCGMLHRDDHTFKSETGDNEVEIFKAELRR